ncbi:type II toxin-antitoxin system RelE/ParE family toxin [Candidatus Woesearchaeota archaeon]|nr:type II toxin-antitoxin system RelE/ParE family toxin [Candidatus Woesearchaeota archaeon]
MYSIINSPHIDKIFLKLSKKNPKQMEIIAKKVEEIAENPNRYKNLRAPLNEFKRVHIDKHFVLIFSIDENSNTITLEDFDRHDNIYIR